jgi:hypothetical protein
MLICIFVIFIIANIGESQTRSSNQVKCDCIMMPGTNKCLKYDNRLQAQNLDEAMSFFEDLSLLDETKPPVKLNRDALV